jgi:organic radical activating enzyme
VNDSRNAAGVERPAPPSFRIAEVYLFDTCTHRCGYCWLAESGQVLDAAQLKPFRDPAFISRVVDFFNSRTADDQKWLLQFTGGEPLLTPNLGSLCDPLLQNGNRVAFYTALLLPESHAGFRFLMEHSAPEVDYIMASYHPEAELDELTYFRKIERLKSRGHNVIIRYVGHSARLSRMDAIEARCRELDVCFYPTTLLSNTHPREYAPAERAALAEHFTSLSQHIQLAGGLRTETLTCSAGSRLIAINLQTGNITPCITVDRPSLGNLFTDTLALYEGPGTCPVSGIACVCDIHYQQSIVSGIDDSRAFAAQKRGYVDPVAAGARLPAAVASMAFYQGVGMGIGTVQDTWRLYFTRDEVKQRWQSRQRERRVDALGYWSLSAIVDHSQTPTIDVRLKNAQPLQHVELFLNEAPDGSASGDWSSIYSGAHTGSDLALTVTIPAESRGPGQYRVALNVHFTDGTICYWYSQPPHILRLGS